MTSTVSNPWSELPGTAAEYVLPCDEAAVRGFNERFGANPNRRLHLELQPEPYLGHPDAPIVLLNMNPAFRQGVETQHNSPAFRQASRRCLLHEPQPYPFFVLDPDQEFPGYSYWKKALKEPIGEFGECIVANSFVTIEFVPYRSKRFAHGRRRLALPSQDYTFHLVRSAVRRNATIIIMRGRRHWIGAVPDLEAVAHCPNNVRSLSVSQRNCPSAMPGILRILSEAALRLRPSP